MHVQVAPLRALPVAPQAVPVAAGLSVAQIAEELFAGALEVDAWVALPGGRWTLLERNRWARVRPKVGGVVKFTVRPQGGGNSNAVFAAVAAIALAVVAPALAGYAATAIAGFGAAVAGGAGFTALSLGIQAGILVGGGLAIQKLFPTAREMGAVSGDSQSRAFREVAAEGNLLARGGFLPRVIDRRVAPPDIVSPNIFIDRGVQTVDRVLALDGKHAISDVWIDGSPAAANPAVTLDIKAGVESETGYGFVDRITAPTQVGEALSTFSLDGTVIEDQEVAPNSAPRWHGFVTAGHEFLEEINIQIRIDGFVTSDSATAKHRIPLRMRMRIRGASTWVNLPEMHVVGRDPSTVVKDVRLRWDDIFGAEDTGGEIGFEFWRQAPAATGTLSDGTDGSWTADSWFSNGAGLQATANISGGRSGVNVRLDPAIFPKKDYEFQVMRGLAVADGALNSSYQIAGSVQPLFAARLASGVWSVAVAQGGFLSNVSVPLATAIAREWPCHKPGTAKIELRSRGQSVRQVTCYANAEVLDWNGSAWATPTTTSKNPATHYRAVLAQWLAARNVSTAVIDDAKLAAWRQECIDRGYEVSMAIAGENVAQVLATIAEAGLARPVYGPVHSVEYFRDRAADVPVAAFGTRNTEAVRVDIALPERPAGARVTFDDAADNWKAREIDVSIDGAADVGLFERVSFDGIATETGARRRAAFDLLQVRHRRRRYTISAGLEGCLLRPDDLISLTTDLLDDSSQSARIRQALDASTLVLDEMFPGLDAPAAGEGATIADLLLAGERQIAFVSTPSGVQAREIADVEGNVITLETALSSTEGLAGAPVNLVRKSRAEHRVIVTAVEPQADERCIITAVDEAPEIVTEMRRLFG